MKPLSKWWDGYNNHKVVLLDDFELKAMDYMHHYMKMWGDEYG